MFQPLTSLCSNITLKHHQTTALETREFYYSCPHASLCTNKLIKQAMNDPVTALDHTSILITHRRKIDISRNTLAEIAEVVLNLKPLMTN